MADDFFLNLVQICQLSCSKKPIETDFFVAIFADFDVKGLI